jgi:hypothetical protein
VRLIVVTPTVVAEPFRIDHMPVAKELLDILVCPVCKKPVAITDEQDGLRCAACGRVYPIIDDIPVMLVDKARKE